jgi:hypothetical protein
VVDVGGRPKAEVAELVRRVPRWRRSVPAQCATFELGDSDIRINMLLLLAVAWGLTPDFLLHGYTDYAQFKLRPLTLFELHLQTPLPPKLAVLLYLPPGQHALSLRVMDLGSQVLCHS